MSESENSLNARVLLSGAEDVLTFARLHKPGDRSAKDRHWAIAITELEKIVAYIDHYLVQKGKENGE